MATHDGFFLVVCVPEQKKRKNKRTKKNLPVTLGEGCAFFFLLVRSRGGFSFPPPQKEATRSSFSLFLFFPTFFFTTLPPLLYLLYILPPPSRSLSHHSFLLHIDIHSPQREKGFKQPKKANHPLYRHNFHFSNSTTTTSQGTPASLFLACSLTPSVCP
ncbi:MAG: hypothetical protein JOS17DRAFT_9377 [Linnemannia elongata]|nr:MAG: hypothetical protein JOS17DRAFT_9377 [Linnemannia elongata]